MILFDIGDNNNNANTHILLEAPKWFILSRHSILLMARNIDKTLWISRKKKRRTTATSTKKNVKKKLKKKMEKNYHIVRVHFAQLLTSFLQSNGVHVTNNKVFCSFSMKKKRNFFLSLFTLSFFRRTKPQDHIYAKSVRKYDQYYENGYSFARQIHTHTHTYTCTEIWNRNERNRIYIIYEIHFRSIWVNKSFKYPLRWLCGFGTHILNKLAHTLVLTKGRKKKKLKEKNKKKETIIDNRTGHAVTNMKRGEP